MVDQIVNPQGQPISPAPSSEQVVKSAENGAKLDEILAQVKRQGAKLDTVEKKVESGASVMLNFSETEQVIDAFNQLPRKQKAAFGNKIRDLTRADANWLERGVYWVEDKTGGWLPAIGKVAGYGLIGTAIVKGGIRGGKFLVRTIKGDAAGAARAVISGD